MFRDSVPCNYPVAKKVVKYLEKNSEDQLEFEYKRRITKVRFKNPAVEMVLSNAEPIRIQLLKELRRVSSLYDNTAQWLSDADYSDDENEWYEDEKRWLDYFVGRRERHARIDAYWDEHDDISAIRKRIKDYPTLELTPAVYEDIEPAEPAGGSDDPASAGVSRNEVDETSVDPDEPDGTGEQSNGETVDHRLTLEEARDLAELRAIRLSRWSMLLNVTTSMMLLRHEKDKYPDGMYEVSLSFSENDKDVMTLDESLDDSLEQQIVNELRRLSAIHSSIADSLQENLDRGCTAKMEGGIVV